MNGLLIAACREDETAAASSTRTNGLSAFTYGLLGVLANPEVEGVEVGYGSSSAAVHQAVTAKLVREGFRQRPLLKEPVAPAGLGSRSFINLGTVTTPTVSAPTPTAPASGGSWMDQLLQSLQVMFPKEPTMQAPTKGAQMNTTADKGWGDLVSMIPSIVNLGMEVYQTVTKEGLLPADKAVMPAGATQEEQEKWIEFIPQIVNLGVQVYQSLSKGDLLPPEKSASISEGATLQEPEKWIEFIPQIVSIGLDVYNSLKSKGFVAQDKAAFLPENTTQQEAEKWLSLIPTAIGIGLQVYNSLKSKGLILDVEEATKAVSMPAPGNGASKETMESKLGETVVEALGRAGYHVNAPVG